MSVYPAGIAEQPGLYPPAQPQPADADRARTALRRVAAGVTVFTVNQGGLRHGTTVSAVAAMSRDPLILGGCLRRDSVFAAMVRAVGRFSVNVLGSTQWAEARRFADPARPAGDAQFAGLPWSTDVFTGAPLIGGSLAHLSCRALRWHPVGDYDLLLAEVIGGDPGASGTPLLSFTGRLYGTSITPLYEPEYVPAGADPSIPTATPSEAR